MIYLLRGSLPFLPLALALIGQDRAKTATPCEIRAYLIDKDHRAASLNGVTGVLVMEDQSGKELRLAMTIVTAQENRPQAPLRALRSAPVDGTSYTVALCAFGGDDRKGKEPSRDETGGPKVNQSDPPIEGQDGGRRIVLDFDVPYFRGQIPADHRCGPNCKMSVRFTIGGTPHSTSSFPCAAKWKSDVPTCCLHHQLAAECSELRRHLAANDKPAALADLDRLSAGLQRNDTRAKNETDRQACIAQIGRIRSAISADNLTEASAATDTLKDTCAACFDSCAGTDNQ